MTDDEIKADRALCDAATPGPWHAEGFYRTDEGGIPHRWRIFLRGHANPKTNSRDCDWTERDALFIAAARTRWPAALDEIERLRARLAAAEGATKP